MQTVTAAMKLKDACSLEATLVDAATRGCGVLSYASCPGLHRLVNNTVKMAKGDPKKPKGKMSAYAFYVQMCREECKKKNPEATVNFAEFSKK